MKQCILAAAAFFTLLLAGCGVSTQSSSSSPAPAPDSDNAHAPPAAVVLTAQQAYDRMESGDPLVVLDVRTAEEYAQAHIPGALLLPNEEIGDTPPAMLPVLDTEILIYCRSGNRSAQAAQKLVNMGYTNVYDFGGINSWTYETQTGDYISAEKDGTLSSFNAFDLNGLMVDEKIFADYDLTMINIWATFCGYCLREMPALNELAAEYADQGVQIVGIPVDVSTNADGTYSTAMVRTARELVDETGAHYPHLLPSADLFAAKLDQVSSVPETIFVDREGQLVGDSYLGEHSKEEWMQIIHTLQEEVKK